MPTFRFDRKLKPLGLTQDEVRTLFEHRDGKLYWRVKRKGMNPGHLAGGLASNGYWRITIGGRSYKRSRLVWLYVFGVDSFPLLLDHINRDRSDDREENLRLVTVSENQSNRSWGKSSERYVYLEEGRWRARVSTSDGRKSLGRFATEAEAVAAINEWENAA